MNSTEPTTMLWRKSSHSNGQANCVEVATLGTGRARIVIRDSKTIEGPYLAFTIRAWRQLISNFEASVRQ